MSSNRISIDREAGRVTKCYRSVIARDNERIMLQVLAGSGLAPRLLAEDGLSLTMSYINGIDCLTLLEAAENGRASEADCLRMLDSLLDWLEEFSEQLGDDRGYPVLEDLQLRNFIAVTGVSGVSIVGIDFECYHRGSRDENPARLAAVLGCYRLRAAAMLREYICRRGVAGFGAVFAETIAVKERELLARRAVRPLIADSTAVILTGGHSSRMGCPKATLLLGEYRFLDRLVYALESFDRMALSVATVPDFDTGALLLWQDSSPDCGPMVGLGSSLAYAETTFVFVTPCDTPLLDRELITLLFSRMEDDCDCVVPRTADGIHPLTAIYRRRVLPQVRQLLQSGNYRMMGLLNTLQTRYVDIPPELSRGLCNINTPADYAVLQP